MSFMPVRKTAAMTELQSDVVLLLSFCVPMGYLF